MAETLTLDIDGRVARIAINRPDKRNAIDQAMWQRFPELVETAVAAPGVRVILLVSATAGMFSAGADIGEFAALARDPDWQARNRAAIRRTQVAIAGAGKPTVAVVDGDCIGGGCGLALACDLRIASTRARFGAAEIAANSPFSTKAAKATVRRILDGVRDDDADSAALFDAAFAGADFAEGVAAFQARRPPRFGD